MNESLTSLNRNCPECDKLLTYKNEDRYHIANGKNSSCRSCSQRGKVMPSVTDETRLKMREAKLGCTFTPEHRQNMSTSLRKYTDEQRLIVSRHRGCFRIYLQGRNIYLKKYIGVELLEFKKHIEAKFCGEMNWDNHGTIWELDHVLPLSSFDVSNEDELYKAWNYTNIQPLLKLDNRRKKSKTSVK